jgi:hypothetical protein
MRNETEEKTKLKKGNIFRTSDTLKRIECKNAFRDLLIENGFLNDKRQEKIDFYYSPYYTKSGCKDSYKINFEDSNQESTEMGNKNFKEKAHKKWKSILNQIMSKDPTKLRTFLKSVNPSLYSRLRQLGQQYFLREFKQPTQKLQFPDIENPKVEIKEHEEITLESTHLEEGIRMLKKAVKYRILNQGFTMRDRSMNDLPRSKSHNDLITPLVFLLRGNKEITIKKKEILKTKFLEKKNDSDHLTIGNRELGCLSKIRTFDILETSMKSMPKLLTPKVKSKYLRDLR